MHSSLQAGIFSALVAAGMFAFGWLAADLATRRSGIPQALVPALALPAVVAWGLLVMLLHIVSGGRVLSHPWLSRLLTGVAAAALLARRVRSPGPRGERGRRGEALAMELVAALALGVWGSAVFRMYPLPNTGDAMMHMGWASQLLNGATTPSAMITGEIPNYYPWLYHGIVALLADLLPGGRAYSGMGPLQLIDAAGMALGLYGLGRVLTGRPAGGAAAALFGSVSGGFGFLIDHRLTLAGGRYQYLGDLLFARPYNVSFDNLAPPLPRDLTYALVPAFALLLVLGARRRDHLLLAGSGVVMGLLGLTGGEAFFLALVTALLTVALVTRSGRSALALLVPGIGLALLWLGPLALNYARLGGFVNTSLVSNEPLPAADILFSWGVVTPLAAYGAWCGRGSLRRWTWRSIPFCLLAAAGILLAAATVGSAVGLGSFASIGKPHRYWPLLFLALAPPAATGTRSRAVAGAFGALVLLVTIASPLIGGMALASSFGGGSPVTRALGGGRNLLNAEAPAPGSRCVAAVPPNLDFLTFSYSGYKQVFFAWGGLHHNRARVRWRDIYRRIPGDRRRIRDNRILTHGVGPLWRWKHVARRYGVNVVVAPADRARAAVFATLPREQVGGPRRGRYLLVHATPRTSCERS